MQLKKMKNTEGILNNIANEQLSLTSWLFDSELIVRNAYRHRFSKHSAEGHEN